MPIRPIALSIAAVAAAAALAGCQELPDVGSASAPPQACGPALGRIFDNDPQTSVVLIKQFETGEKLVLPGDNAPNAPSAARPLCLVKLNVGPGNPGPAGAPSTSSGIGIEIWLPAAANWNERIHALGGGGFQGGVAGSANQVGSPMAAMVAMGEGAVSSINDAGHASQPKNYGIPDSDGDFLMNPDGSIASNLWRDFSSRGIHEQAVKTKAVTRAFYGRPARHAYWDGSSTGGRQGHKLAQAHPLDFDGIVANLPALHWTKLLPAMAYPHIVIQNDLAGKPLTRAQLDLASNAAIAACDMVGGQHLGFILDQASCTYDPLDDPAVLCRADGGGNDSPACLSRKQALAVNKMWYGPTSDGSVPDPAVDNGWKSPPSGKHLWYGLARGTSLYADFFEKLLGRPTGAATPESPQFLGTDQLALQGQNAALGGPDFDNASTDRRDAWKNLSYAQFAAILQAGETLNRTHFAGIDTDDPDLSAFEASGGKLLFWHGSNDEVIPVQGSTQYYDSVIAAMGGLERVQAFYRFYVVPGAGHQSPNGTSNPAAKPPIFGQTSMYDLLVNWVENGAAPGRAELTAPGPGEKTAPACLYPSKAAYRSGDPKLSASYICAFD